VLLLLVSLASFLVLRTLALGWGVWAVDRDSR